MDMPINTFKRALNDAQGPTLWGLWLGLPDPSCAEICAGAGFDWLLVDGEHAPFELSQVSSHLRAIAPYSSSPIVRVEEGRTSLLKRVLDCGAQTVLVPMVDDAEQAQAIVQAVRYPPQGIRGMGSSLARAAHWNQVPNYVSRANDEVCLIVQVETVTAIANLQQIVAVEGVDAVFIGPSDLSASMGHVGNPDHPDVVAEIECAISVINGAGKAAGLLCLNQQMAAHYIAKGARFVGVGVDTLLLGQGAKKLLEQCKNTSSEKPESQGSGY